MVKIDLSAPLTGINGKQLISEETQKPVVTTVGVTLANYLLNSEQTEPVKVLDWCRKLDKNEPIELDKTDAEKFRKACDSLKMSVLIKGQVIEALMDQMKAE